MEKDRVFVEIALGKGYLSPEQVKKAWQTKRERPDLPMEQICGTFLSPSRIRRVRGELERLSVESTRPCVPRVGNSHETKSVEEQAKAEQNVSKPTERQDGKEPPAFQKISISASFPAKDSQFGNYILMDEIARGGMGIVFKAKQKGIERIVALKVMRQIDATSQDQIARFHREIEAAGKLKHSNIVSIYDAGVVGEIHYFTMEFIDGEPLSDIIRGKTMSLKSAIALMEKIARAVHYAHQQNIIHRDLKPANILIDPQHEPHITDFGLARDISRNTQLTESGSALGTPYYMSPEQVEAKRSAIGPPTDLYALGIILYEMATGKLPFDSDSLARLYSMILSEPPAKPRKINPSIPEALENIILKAIEKDQKDRYVSAKAFADDLKRYRAGKRIKARPASSVMKAGRYIRKQAKWVSCLVFSGMLCLVFFFLWVSSSLSHRDPKSLEIARTLQETKGLFASKQFQRVCQKGQEALKSHATHAGSLALYPLVAQAHESSGEFRKAIELYQSLYLRSGDPQDEWVALKGMAKNLLAQREYLQAWKVVQAASQRFGKVKRDPEFDEIEGKSLFHIGDFEKAKPLLASAHDDSSFYPELLDFFTPSKTYPCRAIGVALSDIDQDGKEEIVLIEKERVSIHSSSQDGLKEIASIECDPGGQFLPQIAWGDITGDGEKEAVTAIRHGESNHLVMFRKEGSGYRKFYTHALGTCPYRIKLAKLGPGPKESILLGMGYPSRESKIFNYTGQKFQITELDPDLRKSNTDVLDLDTGDIDGDGKLEIVVATAYWTFYDVRAYGYAPDFSRIYLKAYKRLGVVCAVQVVDMDEDGRPEILAAKRYTVNSEIFGPSSPCGEPDGLYIFKAVPKTFETQWQYTFPPTKNPIRDFRHLCVGHSRSLGKMVFLQYNAVHSATIDGVTKTRTHQEIWIVFRQRGAYHQVLFTPARPSLGLAMGDIDGDRDAELLMLQEGTLFIGGVNSK